MKTGIQLIAAERKRQIEKEGWTAKHDDEHQVGEMATAGACYALVERPIYRMRHQDSGEVLFKPIWPWGKEWDKRKKHNLLRCWQIAGALIAAEMDKFLRKHPELIKDAYVPLDALISTPSGEKCDRTWWCSTCNKMVAVTDGNGDLVCVECCLVIASYEDAAAPSAERGEKCCVGCAHHMAHMGDRSEYPCGGCKRGDTMPDRYTPPRATGEKGAE